MTSTVPVASAIQELADTIAKQVDATITVLDALPTINHRSFVIDVRSPKLSDDELGDAGERLYPWWSGHSRIMVMERLVLHERTERTYNVRIRVVLK